MSWPDVQPIPGPFGSQLLTLRFRVPWEDVGSVQQVVQQAAAQAGVQAGVQTRQDGNEAEVEVRAEGGSDALDSFARALLALASLLSVAAMAALRGALAYGALQIAPALGGVAQALAGVVQGIAQQVQSGSPVPWLIGGGIVLLLLTRR